MSVMQKRISSLLLGLLLLLLLLLPLFAQTDDADAGGSAKTVMTNNNNNNNKNNKNNKNNINASSQRQRNETRAEMLQRTLTKHLGLKRKEQVREADRLLSQPDYGRRYRLTKQLLDTLFSTLRAAQRRLDRVAPDLSAPPFTPLPADKAHEAVLADLVSVWENMAFFGDLALRLPEIVHSQTDTHDVRRSLVAWGLGLCVKAPVYAQHHRTQFEVVAQEMQMWTAVGTERDPHFRNPFREQEAKQRQLRRQAAQYVQKEQRRKRLAVPRGPRMSLARRKEVDAPPLASHDPDSL